MIQSLLFFITCCDTPPCNRAFLSFLTKGKRSKHRNDRALLEALVTPTVTLSAVNAAGATVSTNVSSNEAVFVAGVFSNDVVLSNTAKAQLAVDLVVSELKNGTVAFVLPGVNLLIFPVGLVVTGSWFVIGLVVIGFGFFERVQYRENYRRRVARAGTKATSRI